MKTVSDDLFRLVKSLNKSEKGFFKKFAAKNNPGSRQNYIVLFDAVDKMESYDEDKLRRTLKDETFIKQLPVYKVYLFNLILKSLSQYGAYDNASSRIKELIEHAKTLESKGLFKEALKLLMKAKEMAVKYKNKSQLLEILIAERNLMVVLPDKNVYENRKKVYEELRRFADDIVKYSEYSWLADQLLIFIEQKGDFKSGEREQQVQKILKHPYMRNFALADDYLYKSYYHNAHLMYNISKNNIGAVYDILKNIITLLEEYRHLIDDNPKNYIQALINFLLACSFLNKKEETREGIVKLNRLRRRLRNKVPLSLQIHTMFHASNTEMLIYRNNCDMKRGRLTAKKAEAAVQEYSHEIPLQLKITLLSNIACFYVIDENFESALRLNNVLLKETSINFKNDIHYFTRLMQLLIHFELGSYDLLEYLVGSNYKFFKEHSAIHKAEAAIFEFFKKALRLRSDEMPDAYGELHYRLKNTVNDSHAVNLMVMFDFISWAESKIKGKKLTEILKSKRGLK